MKNLIPAIVSLFLISFSFYAHAGRIAETFGEGVFGVKWGDDLGTVKKSFPTGTEEVLFGITHLSVQDGRTIFDIERRPDEKILFVFDSNKQLVGINIYFPQRGLIESSEEGTPSDSEIFGSLLNKLTTLFGKHDLVPDIYKNEIDPGFGVYAGNAMSNFKWQEDEGISISLSQYMMASVTGVFWPKSDIEHTLVFIISVQSQTDTPIDKNQLGLE